MDYEIGSIVTGKVTGITKFGVFVALGNGKSGMVHISEVAPVFVKEIRDFVTDNQEVTVKIVSIDENGRIALSIKQALTENPQTTVRKRFNSQRREPQKPQTGPYIPAEFDWGRNNSESLSFEDKLTKFKQDSDEKMLALKRCVEGKRGSASRRSRH